MTRSLVIGLGRSGVALARFLVDRGDEVAVCDTRTVEQLTTFVGRLPRAARTILGGYGHEVLAGCDEVYASPGVPWNIPLLESARAAGIRVSSEMDLFFRHCPAPIVGITGTNGKTTTTALTGAVLSRGARPVMVGGNIGETVLDRLAEVTPEHWVVLELSSFQLESIERPRAAIGVVLNVTPDHLDRHGSFAAYVAAKARLVEYQEEGDWAVLNGADRVCRGLASLTRAQVAWYELEPAPPMPVPGEHNLMNARAASVVGRLAGLTPADIHAAIAGFEGVEHRLELVGDWSGVRWYNDSKATNPDAALVGLRSFGESPVILVAGGRGSGFELAEWLSEIRRRARAVILIGESAEVLEAELVGHPAVRRAASLVEAVAVAADLARPGDVVLLSPGYKSFDSFASFEDRGRQFKAAVHSHHGPAGRSGMAGEVG